MIGHHTIATKGPGLYEFSDDVARFLDSSGRQEGLCTLFLRHTSASLIIQENADPTARTDLERWLGRLVPPEPGFFRHQSEGPDDMPAHVKAALGATSLSIPFAKGCLLLGTWQGIYLWEHRDAPHRRNVVIHLG